MTWKTLVALVAFAGLVSCAPPVREHGVSGPLPDSAFRVTWRRVDVPAAAPAGSTFPAIVGIRNMSDSVWPDPWMANPEKGTGGYAVRLAYCWFDARGENVVSTYGARTDLPFPLSPNQYVELPIDVTAPAVPGKYQLQFDLVQELVSWFEPKGNERWMIPFEVE